MKGSKTLAKSGLWFVYAWLYLPMLVLVIYAFNRATFSLQWQGFTLHWYRQLFQDTTLWSACGHSLLLSFSAASLATCLSLFACISLFLYRAKRARGLNSIIFILMIIPDLVLGVALLMLFNQLNWPLGFLSLLVGHTTFCIPFAMLTLYGRLNTLNPNIYFSALDLGASRMTALWRILLPLMWPAILSALLLSMTLSFDDVVISYFIAGPDFTILPLMIYSMVRAGITPELNALCAITFSASVIMTVMSHQLGKRGL